MTFKANNNIAVLGSFGEGHQDLGDNPASLCCTVSWADLLPDYNVGAFVIVNFFCIVKLCYRKFHHI
jgi:hypothetical protein